MHGHRLYIICLVIDYCIRSSSIIYGLVAYLANRYQFYMIYDFLILTRLSLDKKMHQQFLTQLEMIESLDIANDSPT